MTQKQSIAPAVQTFISRVSRDERDVSGSAAIAETVIQKPHGFADLLVVLFLGLA